MIQRCGFNQSISLWSHVLHRQKMTVNRNPGIGAPKEWPWDLCFPIELECSCWEARPLCTTLLKLQQNGHCDMLWQFEVSRLVMMHRNRKTMFLMLCDPPQNEWHLTTAWFALDGDGKSLSSGIFRRTRSGGKENMWTLVKTTAMFGSRKLRSSWWTWQVASMLTFSSLANQGDLQVIENLRFFLTLGYCIKFLVSGPLI